MVNFYYNQSNNEALTSSKRSKHLAAVYTETNYVTCLQEIDIVAIVNTWRQLAASSCQDWNLTSSIGWNEKLCRDHHDDSWSRIDFTLDIYTEVLSWKRD